MVKNAGGKRTKGAARKFMTAKPSNKLRLSECPDEKYAYVTKMLGGCECSVTTVDNINLLCHIRNKFSGRNKQSNFISIGSVVLVGLRTWENPAKKCDLIEVYNADEVDKLQQIPGINLITYKPSSHDSIIATVAAASEGDIEDDGFVFRRIQTSVSLEEATNQEEEVIGMTGSREFIDIDSI